MEKSIIFKSDMVRAILDGRKTQTRRIIKPQPEKGYHAGLKCTVWYYKGLQLRPYKKDAFEAWYPVAPYKVGDKLWVRETHYLYGHWVKNGKTKTGKQAYKFVPKKSTDRAYWGARYLDNPPVEVCTKKNEMGWFKRPSIFMKKEHARLWLKVIGVRGERVQDISGKDVIAEGIKHCADLSKMVSDKARFLVLWESIYGFTEYAWRENPWVFVTDFKVIKP